VPVEQISEPVVTASMEGHGESPGAINLALKELLFWVPCVEVAHDRDARRVDR